MISLSWRLARRELRGGLRGFVIFVACLALGVAAIAGAGSMDAALRRAMAEDSRALLGGDVELQRSYRPADADELAFLRQWGQITTTRELRAMAIAEDRRTLVEIKAVDGLYPLFGKLELAPSADLEQKDGLWGAAVDANLLDRLGLKIGDALTIGQTRYQIRATIVKEPDRIATPFSLGPRLLLDQAALDSSGLVQPGSLIRQAVLIALAPGRSLEEFRTALNQRFPTAGWLFRGSADAAPGVKRFLDNLTLFLTLVGLTALLVGGIGVANAVRAFLDGRVTTIATLKCLGASRRLIVWIYVWQIAFLAGLGIVLGLAVGAALPFGVSAVWGDHLPVVARLSVYPQPLALAATFGLLTALAFATWPLARAGQIPAATLFRDLVAPGAAKIGGRALAVIALAGLALAALAVVTAADRRLAIGFVGGAGFALVAFTVMGAGLVKLAKATARSLARRASPLSLRLALSSLHRPGNPTKGVVLSLGLGLTVLVAVALIQANLSHQLSERLPREAPTFFFIDIQPDQAEAFDRIVAQSGGRLERRAAMVRGRITQLNGVAVENVMIAPDAQWAIKGDRGLTSADVQPADSQLVAGAWWPRDYSGPPLVSLDAGIAKGFGLTVGQTVSINVLGREITVTIASLREINWSNLSMNFTFILSPNALAGAPHTDIATVFAPSDREFAVERAVTDALPGISSIRVKEALDSVRSVAEEAALAIRAAAAITLAAGALVLAGAISAGQARRIREAVLLKVLGARRIDLLRALLLEYVLLGAATGLLAGVLGSVAAWAVDLQVLHADWLFQIAPVAGVVLGGIAAVAAVGLAGTAQALSTRPAPWLRHD